METKENSVAPKYRRLRIWIPVVLLLLMVVAKYFSVWFPEIPMVWAIGAFVPGLMGVLILLWWLLLSRATWAERILGLIGVITGLIVIGLLLDPSMLGPPVIVLTIPSTIAAFAIALVFMHRVLSFRRAVVAVVFSFLVGGFSLLLRNEGATGDFGFGLHWRWQQTAEQEFLAARKLSDSTGAVRRPNAESFINSEWPGFRGKLRDGIQRGVAFSSDWQQHPPEEKWRIRVGPAWSSFAVADSFLFTQEQRGDFEAVVCYDGDSGLEVWSQEIQSRFFDALGGLGPRATPYISGSSLYAQGAEGWLVRLNAIDGQFQWQVDLRDLTDQPAPMWGYSCSPLVHRGLVVVHAAGPDDRGIFAFDAETGEVRWSVSADKDSYSSLHLTNYFGQEQLVFLGDSGARFLDPLTGETLLHHQFEIKGYRALQPAVIDSQQLLFTSEYAGTRLIALQKSDTGIESTEVWTSRGIKPDFNDLVIQDGFAYGFDGAIFTCIDLSDGSRSWKKGRYGKGQVLLLADSKLLLVVSELGDLLLLDADPKEHRELFNVKALDGKTWNHPVVVGERLYLRNANEAVCYQLPLKSSGSD